MNEPEDAGGCPFAPERAPHPTQGGGNRGWWPDRLNLRILAKNPAVANPLGEEFDYAAAFESLDLAAVKQDIEDVLTTSQEWWPADYGHYGPFMIRMAWHSAGTYRISDGRGGAGGGQQRFAPLNSWPDNANLDKARRLLWPVKQKYGQSLSWADLMVLTGNVALESMGFETFGFAGGREDVWEPDEDVYWGPEKEWLGDERYTGDRELEDPLGAVQMGLIYVNPEGPNGNPDPAASARDIRETFSRMAMNDEETVALIAGGHTFGKTHGAADPDEYVGAEPEGAALEEQGLGWHSSFNSGKGVDTITSGLEGAWTPTPVTWDHSYFQTLFEHEWELVKSPAGAHQWAPKGGADAEAVPDAHDPSRRTRRRCRPRTWRCASTRSTSRSRGTSTRTPTSSPTRSPAPGSSSRTATWDPSRAISDPRCRRRSCCGRTRSPRSRTSSSTRRTSPPSRARSSAPGCASRSSSVRRGRRRRRSAAATSAAAPTAPAYASSRRTAGRSTIRPTWRRCCARSKDIQASFNGSQNGSGKRVSLADLIVLGGCAAIEQAAENAGHDIEVPFTPGRADASQEQTDADSFAALEPKADGFRNYLAEDHRLTAEYLLVDKANLLTLSAPEMTVLVGGLRVLGANSGGSSDGVLTERPGSLTNDFFVNLLDLDTAWSATADDAGRFEGRDRATGEVRWTGTRVDLVFGSNSELRALAEVYAADDAREKFVHDFVAAWDKVMNLDRFELG